LWLDWDSLNGDTEVRVPGLAGLGQNRFLEDAMAWETPKFEEVSCGFEVTMYLPAEL
jgi:coenzyme PQQ precursor peptide PqqA